MLNIGGGELLIILLVALVFLGPTRLPEVARQVGQTVSSLRSLASGFQAELEAASRPDVVPEDPFMKMKGPMSQEDAIAQTQDFTQQPTPNDIVRAARKAKQDEEDAGVNPGGPTDLRDEEE